MGISVELEVNKHKMIEEQHELLSNIHQMHEKRMRTLNRDGNRNKDTE